MATARQSGVDAEEEALELGGRVVPRELMAEVLRDWGLGGVMGDAVVSRG